MTKDAKRMSDLICLTSPLNSKGWSDIRGFRLSNPVNHIQYFALKVKDMVDIYLFHQTAEELTDDFERHEIAFLRHVSEIEANKNSNLICMFNSGGCRIVDAHPKEKYCQTNFGDRYVLFRNPTEIISSLGIESSHFSFRKYLSGLLNINTYTIKNLLSIFFLRKRCQEDDEIIEFDRPPSLLEILEAYGKGWDSPRPRKIRKIRPSENTHMANLYDVRKLESDKFCYAPPNEWFSRHLVKISAAKDVFLILKCLEQKFAEMKVGAGPAAGRLSVPGSSGSFRYKYYKKERSRAAKKREFESEIRRRMKDYLS